LLGVSGLITAYRSAAASALQDAEKVEKIMQDYYEITYPYISMNDIMRILKEDNIGQSQQSFDLECSILINFRVSAKEKVLTRLSRIEGLRYRYIETR
jgi:putative IMPACT (imprinted ancient) family translation regulator